MHKLAYSFLALLFLLLPALAQGQSGPPPYFNPGSVNFKRLLPNPPAVGSPEARAELDQMVKLQAKPIDSKARARIVLEANKLNIWLFADVLGPWFNAKNLPVTAKLFSNVDYNEWLVTKAAKDFWNRPRPPVVDKRIKLLVELPKNASYPSGHSTYGTVNALVLAALVPDLKDALIARGRQIGDDRVLAGVHYPSDVAAGRTLGNSIFQYLQMSAKFQADLAAASDEIAAARAKAAANNH